LKKRALTAVSVIIFIICIAFFNQIVDFVINIEWYTEVGYLSVYFTKLKAILILMAPIFLVSFFTILLYYRSLRKNLVKWMKAVEVDANKDKVEKKIFYVANTVLSLIFSFVIAVNYWYTILQFQNAVSFNTADPIFGLDVSFYVFKLPLIQSLFGTVLSLLVILVMITLVSYLIVSAKETLDGAIRMRRVPDFKSLLLDMTRFAGKQIAVLCFLLMIMLAAGYAIKALYLVYSTTGVTFGASYTDIHVSLLFYKIIVVVSLASAVVIFISLLRSKTKPILISVALILVLIAAQTATAFSMQRFIVKSNEKTFEQPYIKYNIDFTRKAYAVDNVEIKSFPVKDDITSADIDTNKDTIENIRINSFGPALEFYNQVQIIRYYYDFNDLDLDRYTINGNYNQVFIAPREINTDLIEPKTWQNKHLIYTHGYGLAMNKVNSITSEGQPDFVIKDIPPENSTDLTITNPRIYYGEKTNSYAIVNTKISEFDYPKGSDVQTTTFKENAGINMTLGNKILFAINERDLNFLLSRDITSESKILINRNIVERVKTIAPFLTYDSDPYAVLSNGKIYWILDAYTTSNKYPFSQPQGSINYIRNSVKVVIDAVDGSTSFYRVDKTDPIAASYAKIFPGLFKDDSSISADLRAHFKYPDDIFKMQCSVLGKYHVTDPGVFYNGEDVWEVAKSQKEIEGEKIASESPYVVMKLPGMDKEEMILLEYFNMRSKDNMAALFTARMDGENYGKMVVYTFPPQKTIYSPYLFRQKVNQDTTISKELALWNKEGSEVLFGDTIIIPINHSLLYVEPMYLRASGESSIPEVKRIILSYSDKIILAESVDSGLKQLFDYKGSGTSEGTTGGTTAPSTGDSATKIQEAKGLYEKAIEAQKNGDWSSYGNYIKQLGQILEELNQ